MANCDFTGQCPSYQIQIFTHEEPWHAAVRRAGAIPEAAAYWFCPSLIEKDETLGGKPCLKTFHAARLRATPGRSCSPAATLFFKTKTLPGAESAKGYRTTRSRRARRVLPRASATSDRASRRDGPAANGRPRQKIGPLAAHGLAAGLPVARARCAPFTTLAAPTPN